MKAKYTDGLILDCYRMCGCWPDGYTINDIKALLERLNYSSKDIEIMMPILLNDQNKFAD